MKKKINWKLISDIAVIISMTAVLIGFIFLANRIQELQKEIDKLNVIHAIKETLYDEYDVDPGIKVE